MLTEGECDRLKEARDNLAAAQRNLHGCMSAIEIAITTDQEEASWRDALYAADEYRSTANWYVGVEARRLLAPIMEAHLD